MVKNIVLVIREVTRREMETARYNPKSVGDGQPEGFQVTYQIFRYQAITIMDNKKVVTKLFVKELKEQKSE